MTFARLSCRYRPRQPNPASITSPYPPGFRLHPSTARAHLADRTTHPPPGGRMTALGAHLPPVLHGLAVHGAPALPAVHERRVVAGAAVDAVALAAAERVDRCRRRRRRTRGPCRCPGAARRCRGRRRCGRAPGRRRCGRCPRCPPGGRRSGCRRSRRLPAPPKILSWPREPGMWSPQITSLPPSPRSVSPPQPPSSVSFRGPPCSRSAARDADRLGAPVGVDRGRRLARSHHLAVAEPRGAGVAAVDEDGVVAGAACDQCLRERLVGLDRVDRVVARARP